MDYFEVMKLARKHQAARRKTVLDMVSKGNTWEQIGLVLGVTRQRAYALYKQIKRLDAKKDGTGGTAGDA
jgi:hypothetical protein